MRPDKPLPHSDAFANADAYVDSLLNLIETSEQLRTLVGGVHILDFYCSEPDLYSSIIPKEWRDFFARHEIMDLLDLFMREDLDALTQVDCNEPKWRGGLAPPATVVEYIRIVRLHCLDREPKTSHCSRNRTQKKLDRQVAIGMSVKKIHEVGLFASYIDSLSATISAPMDADNGDEGRGISHFVDFGSGQSYLGRALASEPYNRHIVAIESKTHNTERANFYDVKARLVEKQMIMRNKKLYRAGLVPADSKGTVNELPTPPPEPAEAAKAEEENLELPKRGRGSIQHVAHRILNGDLTDVISNIHSPTSANLIVMSLHSCGNLVHHGLRSLILNPSVRAVAMVGCCYNLITERLGPATYKHPILRPTSHAHAHLQNEDEASDAHGFPMSDRFCNQGDKGVRLNITARMMAVQAPSNWGEKDSDVFFTRHFYRALLQRVFLDRGVIGPPNQDFVGGMSPAGHSSGGTPIIIGSLRKGCYADFVAYVRGALEKLYEDANWGSVMKEKMSGISDAEIEIYEERFRERKKELSVVWSLMAFSAGVVEAAIVVDRSLWLREQEVVGEAWVEAVFDYGLSPRNLVVVGVKK